MALIEGIYKPGGGAPDELRPIEVGPTGAVKTEGAAAGAATTPADITTGIDGSIDVEAIKVGIGAPNESAPATDTASAGLNGRLQKVAQNITTLISRLPSSIGKKVGTNSLSVTLASDESLAQLPATLGAKTIANSLSIALASDQGLPLPTGAATETTMLAILAELRDDFIVNQALFEDRSAVVSVFYRETQTRSLDDGTLATTYVRLSDGVTVGSMPVGVIPVQGATDRAIEFYRWKLKNAGTGYSAGDWATNTLVYDTGGSGAVLSSTWYNLISSATIAAPLSADLSDPNDQLLAVIGGQADAAATSDTGTFSLMAFVKRGLGNWTTLLGRIPTIGAKTIAGSISTAIASDQVPTSAAQRWFAQLSDGTSSPTINPASTTPGVAAPSLTVALSPNSNLPPGAASDAAIGSTTDVTVPATSTATATLKGLLRFIANLIAPATTTLTGSGIGAFADVACPNRIRSISVLNNTATDLFLQVHNKATALAAADAPFSGTVFLIPANSNVILGVVEFGLFGRVYGTQAQQRLGLSTTLGTYTANVLTAIAVNVEVI